MAIELREVVWQFNEAVSLLQEARRGIPDGELVDLVQEIDDGLPNIMQALRDAATEVENPSD